MTRNKRLTNLSRVSVVIAVILLLASSNSLWFFITGELRKIKTPEISITERYYKRLEVINSISSSESWDLVIIGDSLAHSIKPKLFSQCCVINAFNMAISGETAENLLMRIKQDPLPPANHYYVLIGTNDIGRNAEISKVLQNIRLIGEYLGFSKVTFISIPMTNGFQRDNSKLIPLNTGIEEISFNSNAKFLNINKVLTIDGKLNGSLSTDGLHFNEEGIALVVKVISMHHNSIETGNQKYLKSKYRD